MAKKDYDKILTRITGILSKLSNNENPTVQELAQEYNVSTKTIQRDIFRRLIGFPIVAIGGKIMFTDGYSIKDGKFNIEELSTLSLSLMLIKDAGKDFERSAKELLSRLVAHKLHKQPYYIKPDFYEYIDTDSALANKIEDAILNSHELQIKTRNKDKFLVCPLKLANISGIWYLFCKVSNDANFKSFIFSSIESAEATGNIFTPIKEIDEILAMMGSEHYHPENIFSVKVKISKEVSHYFSLKKHLPSQEIISKEEDNSLIISFQASHAEDVDNLIKSWLPHIAILEPKWLKDQLLEELGAYLLQQNS
ncbi:MAG TPA: WYL domain-containing protein [Campylobacterales bacterium]|nr:WYL domain-containing protein [Campylobacterales bacterium]